MPGKRQRGGIWYIFWRAGPEVYEYSTGRVPEHEAEQERLELALGFRSGEWPDRAKRSRALERYLSEDAPQVGDLLAEYERHLRANVGRTWATTSLAHLRELTAVSGKPLEQVTPADAQGFLDHIPRTPGPYLKNRGPRAAATRNRARVTCNRFFKWAKKHGIRRNPFEETSKLREDDIGEIVHLSRKERDAVLVAANGDPEEPAAWLALFTGMRRGEIARCKWADIDLRRRKLAVRKAKTGRVRSIDLATALVDYLKAHRKSGGAGCVVGWSAEIEAMHYASQEFIKRLRARLPKMPAKKVAWNSFRHTFASLLVQAGVSVFKVASWMGNSPEVCRKHYAAMMPEFDEDIDRIS